MAKYKNREKSRVNPTPPNNLIIVHKTNLGTCLTRYEALLSPNEIEMNSLENSTDSALQKYKEKLEQAFGLITQTDTDDSINESFKLMAKTT